MRYSLNQIDRMRNAIHDLLEDGNGYDPVRRSAIVEDRIRTYMVAGIDEAGIAELERRGRENFQAKCG